MNTNLYRIMNHKLIESGLSQREFAKKYNLSYAWLNFFISPTRPFMKIRTHNINKLHKELGIPIEVIMEYNEDIAKEKEGR